MTQADDSALVSADPERLAQGLGNLRNNALRHGRGTITVHTHRTAKWVEVHVTDEGSGFPPDLLPRAFERFSRADPARTRGGVGLGLAIVRRSQAPITARLRPQTGRRGALPSG